MADNQIQVTYIDHLGTDLSVVNAARCSFGKKSSYEEQNDGSWVLPERDVKLISYLAKHEHISPFGHCFASFHIKAPVFVARQLVKHKFLRINEVSRRYVDEEPEFYTPDVWRGRSADKKQGSSGSVPLNLIDCDTSLHMKDYWPKHEGWGWNGEYLPEFSIADDIKFRFNDTLAHYNQLLDVGVAPEQARMVLPQSMMTEWYWSGSLDAFSAMCNLRLKDDTQYETRLVAQGINGHMTKLYPHSWKALTNV
jgi:thymidylate synthase (FAD)